jgi:signal transduction histidine kinase
VWLGKEKGQRAVSVAARAMTDDGGRFSGSVIIFKDVTEFVEAIEAKEDFVANVSHEFQTPLTSILGHLELVLDVQDELPIVVGSQLEIVRRNAERLKTLVSDLLITASGSMNIRPRCTDLAELVEHCLGSARVQAKNAGITLCQEVQQPLWAYTDPIRIAQVLDNLISNAIKYSPAGGTVMARACHAEGRVRLLVQDTGIGMTRDEATAVFGKFFRASGAREAGIPGVGLGLSVTKTIVENHGGDIWCSSEPGVGSTFTVELPAFRPADIKAS